MFGDIPIFLFVLVLGCIAFFFCVFMFAYRIMGSLGRGVGHIFTRNHRTALMNGPNTTKRVLVCPTVYCRKLEYRDAQFCSQCGTKFTKAPSG